MRQHPAQGRSIRFQSRQYHDALSALKAAPPLSATVITLAGGSPAELKVGAEQLARSLGRSLFRVNLGMVVSKYIGETEQNLELLFTRAQAIEYVLYFEDGDALFGRGSESSGNPIVEKLAGYRGFIVAALRHPPPPVQPHRKMGHLHFTFPPQTP